MRVKRYMIAAVKHALGTHQPGRRLPVLPDDILLASYPKSGNTWTRFLLANLRFPDREVGFGNVHQLILDPDASVMRDFVRAPRPRIIKSHGSFDPRYRRVICIVRDPRDVAVSQYHYLRKTRRFDDDVPMDRFLDMFLTGYWMQKLGSWGENVASWLATRYHNPGFLLIRYEDLLSDTARELARVAEFGGFPASSDRIARAVELSSVEKMRENEKKEGDRTNLIKGSRGDIQFVRAAKSGGWRNELSEQQAARIEAAWGDVMACLGYDLATRDPRSALQSSLLGSLVYTQTPGGITLNGAGYNEEILAAMSREGSLLQ